MKPIVRRGLGLLLIVACMILWSFTLRMSRSALRTRTCQGKGTLDVIVTDSIQRNFVGREDIEKWLDNEYRAYAGLPLDSVDLTRIESIVTGHSAVKHCEAWLTDDGILHVELSQREPLVRFDDGNGGFYADSEGFIFPLQERGSVPVPVVDGKLPFRVPKGYKGALTDPSHKEWMNRILHLVASMKGTVWERDIRRITASADGDLVLFPLEGKERFLFGQPVNVEEKLYLMGRYYDTVVPAKEPGYYSTVDLRYGGQLVCRK
jgi:cell division protein FtsQ